MHYKILLLALISLLFINSTKAILRDTIKPNGKVILIRHAEKPASGNDLSTMGWRRAECIKELFMNDANLTPKYIYAQMASKKNDVAIPDSRRQIETVAPLARALDYVIDNRYTSFDVDELSTEIGKLGPENFPVLISWNHDDIKNFLINFGMKYQTAPSYPSKRYDLVWTLEYVNGAPQFGYFSQNCTGLGDYRFSSDATKVSQQWMMRSLVIATIAVVLFFI